jgi:hypothetical protein
MDSASIAELEQEVASLKSRVLEIATEIKALLAEDLPKFVERELKNAFVHNPEFANTVSDDTLRVIKAAMATQGAEGTARVLAALENDNIWLEIQSIPNNRKSIEEHTALWSLVSEICQTVTQLYADHGFPQAQEPCTYRAPTWFIGRRYLPSLSEKYWRHVEELQEKKSVIGSLESDTSTSELTQRWDKVSG